MAIDQITCLGKSLVQSDVVSMSTLARFAAIFGKKLNTSSSTPSLWHWCHFLPINLPSFLAEDGHPQRGDFLPDDKILTRRMWAGSRIQFHNHVAPGEMVVCTSNIVGVKHKEGKSGALMFVEVKHDVHNNDGVLLSCENQDIVYRSAAKSLSTLSSTTEPLPVGTWKHRITPDTRLLFQFSAITFNAHRIHYDLPYACEKEGYPNLVVHGPLIACLLLELAEETQPGKKVRFFEFKAVSPIFLGDCIFLNANLDEQNNQINLWACNGNGQLAMRANAEFSS